MLAAEVPPAGLPPFARLTVVGAKLTVVGLAGAATMFSVPLLVVVPIGCTPESVSGCELGAFDTSVKVRVQMTAPSARPAKSSAMNETVPPASLTVHEPL